MHNLFSKVQTSRDIGLQELKSHLEVGTTALIQEISQKMVTPEIEEFLVSSARKLVDDVQFSVVCDKPSLEDIPMCKTYREKFLGQLIAEKLCREKSDFLGFKLLSCKFMPYAEPTFLVNFSLTGN